jgi:tetratricopeptide (TPR) repeat protein
VRHARGDWAGAEKALRRAIALRPDLQGAHYTLGRVLQSAGDADGARAQFAEAERLRRRAQLEQEASVWTSVGTARLDEGQPGAARDCFRRAIDLLETYAPAHYQLGRALDRLDPSLVPPRR